MKQLRWREVFSAPKVQWGIGIAICCVSALFLIAACLLRTLQIFYAVDLTTGFYKEGEPLIPALYAVMAGFFFLMILLVLPLRRGVKEEYYKNPFVGIAVLLLGLTGLIEFVLNGGLSLEPFFGFSDFFKTNGGPLFLILSWGLGGLTYVYFGIAFLFFRKKKMPFLWVGVFPIVYAIVRLLVTFMHFTTIAGISQNLFEILALTFELVFTLDCMALFAGITKRGSKKRIVLWGMGSALFALLVSVPVLIALATQNSAILSFIKAPSYTDLCLALFALSVSVSAALTK